MKLKKNVAAKIIAICLAATMLIGICSASAVTAPKQNGISVGNPVTTAVHSASGGQNSKEETVYVLANADGSVQKIIVSDWLKNPAGANSINDISELDGIENVKGDEAYTMNPNNMRVWDAKGNDIYYQGTTQKALPVDVSISYQLDGKPISAEDLAGKSGRVTIRFSYQNNQKETIEIDGKKETVYVPFVMLTGAVLDNDVFSNVQISNGKLLSDGDRSVVMGFAMPGLQESLNLDKRKLEIPDYVELTADVKDFRLDTTLTVASNDIFNHLDLEDLDAQNLTSAISQLNDAALELVDGSSQLYDGLSALLEKSGELISGIDLLASGAGNLNSGAADLYSGASDLNSGASQLSSGLGELNSNSQNLVGGAKAVFETLLSTAQSQLEAAGVSVPKLTIDNYAAVLDSVLDSLDETTVYDLAYNTALQQVTQAVNAQENEIRVQVEDTVRKQVLEGVLAAAGKAMTAEEYEQACASGLIDADTQTKIASAVSKKMASQEMAETVNSLVSQKKQEVIDQNMQSSQVQSQIQAAVESAKNGESSIAVLKQQLDSYQQFYSGLQDYTDGVAQAYAGSKDLAIGSNELKGGSQQLKDGAQQLYDGISSFQSGSSALVDGVSQLKDGGMQLSEGMKQFNEDGIQKITEAFQGDLSQLAARLKALGDVSRSYQNYSGIADGMSGSVKFVYRTASIEKTADEK